MLNVDGLVQKRPENCFLLIKEYIEFPQSRIGRSIINTGLGLSKRSANTFYTNYNLVINLGVESRMQRKHLTGCFWASIIFKVRDCNLMMMMMVMSVFKGAFKPFSASQMQVSDRGLQTLV